MKIVKPSVELLWITENPLQTIERAGRTCYKSEDRISPDSSAKFVKMLLDRGHEAMIEHASASFKVICDRGVTHEIVRHRLVSYAQESTRYCNYGREKFGNEITVIEPPGLNTDDDFEVWQTACEEAEDAYMQLIAAKISPQIARSVLPTCLKTEIVCTTNLREWRHFLKLRTSTAAHPQMREIAKMILAELKMEVPVLFDDINVQE